MLNAILSEGPSDSRVITIEEVFELDPRVSDLVALQTREAASGGEGAIDLRRLVKEALRMRPSRIVVGEVRGAEALDLLIALNAGVPGAASIHANSAEEAIEKLTLLPLLAGENLPLNFINSLIGRVIDAVIHLEIDFESGKRYVSDIMSVEWRDGAMVYAHQYGRSRTSL
jgi:pilus assembly protein CpaF